MKFYKFNKKSGKEISKFDSNFIMSRIIQTDKPTSIGCIHLEENGVIGYHQAVTSQLLLVLNGEGSVRGETEEYCYVGGGDAVFWKKGEWHETKSENGMTAIVIESEELEPELFMPHS